MERYPTIGKGMGLVASIKKVKTNGTGCQWVARTLEYESLSLFRGHSFHAMKWKGK